MQRSNRSGSCPPEAKIIIPLKRRNSMSMVRSSTTENVAESSKNMEVSNSSCFDESECVVITNNAYPTDDELINNFDINLLGEGETQPRNFENINSAVGSSGKNDRSRHKNDKSSDGNDKSSDGNDRSIDGNHRSIDETHRSSVKNDRSNDKNDGSSDENDRSSDKNDRSKDKNDGSSDKNDRSSDKNGRSSDKNDRCSDENDRSSDNNDSGILCEYTNDSNTDSVLREIIIVTNAGNEDNAWNENNVEMNTNQEENNPDPTKEIVATVNVSLEPLNFSKFVNSKVCSDFEVICEGVRFHGHRLLFARASKYFTERFLIVEEPAFTINANVKLSAFRLIYDYIYGGTLNFNSSVEASVVDIIIAALFLGMDSAIEKCSDYVTENDLFFRVLLEAKKGGRQNEMRDNCVKLFCLTHSRKYPRANYFADLSFEKIRKLLLEYVNEENVEVNGVLEATLKWCSYSSSRIHVFSNLLKFLDLYEITKKDIAECSPIYKKFLASCPIESSHLLRKILRCDFAKDFANDDLLLSGEHHFGKILEVEKFKDFTIYYGTNSLRCHALLLASNCSYFKELFELNADISTIKLDENLDDEVYKMFFGIVYSRSAPLTSENVGKLLICSLYMGFDTLYNVCHKFVIENSLFPQFLTIFANAKTSRNELISKYAKKYILENVEFFVHLKDFHSMNLKDAASLFESKECLEKYLESRARIPGRIIRETLESKRRSISGDGQRDADSPEAKRRNMSAVAPSTSMGPVAPPISMGPVAPPFSMSAVAPPISMSAVAPPISLSAASPPISMSAVAPPIGMGAVAPPISMSAVAPPISMSAVVPPISMSAVSQPISKFKVEIGNFVEKLLKKCYGENLIKSSEDYRHLVKKIVQIIDKEEGKKLGRTEMTNDIKKNIENQLSEYMRSLSSGVYHPEASPSFAYKPKTCEKNVPQRLPQCSSNGKVSSDCDPPNSPYNNVANTAATNLPDNSLPNNTTTRYSVMPYFYNYFGNATTMPQYPMWPMPMMPVYGPSAWNCFAATQITQQGYNDQAMFQTNPGPLRMLTHRSNRRSASRRIPDSENDSSS